MLPQSDLPLDARDDFDPAAVFPVCAVVYYALLRGADRAPSVFFWPASGFMSIDELGDFARDITDLWLRDAEDFPRQLLLAGLTYADFA